MTAARLADLMDINRRRSSGDDLGKRPAWRMTRRPWYPRVLLDDRGSGLTTKISRVATRVTVSW